MSLLNHTDRQSSSIFSKTPDSDVEIVSNDNVVFYLHKKYLEINIGAFPPAETPTNGEPVCLSESSETLEILFQFVYPRRYPLLETLDFDALMLLADAAEKYEVFPLIYACRSEFRNFLQTNSKSVLAFAAMHDYRELVIRLAPTMLDLSIPELVNILPNNLFKPCCIYHESYLNAVKQAAKDVPEHHCGNHTQWYRSLLRSLSEIMDQPSIIMPRNLDATFERFLGSLNTSNHCCQKALTTWRDRIKSIVIALPPLSLPHSTA
ncbi:hypothetical protein F5879DRAFT_932453 [Lentinula edodes]|nr:hypothetical protein F5879DRAFT_932453 [Lentinula edodes]